MACAVTAWSPVIIRTSIPAANAVVTALLASARRGSMMPAIATNARSRMSDIGSVAMVSMESASISLSANASTRSPSRPIRSFAASTSARASSIGTCDPLSGPPAMEHRARTTSGAPLTSATTCSDPSRVIRWNVAMNL